MKCFVSGETEGVQKFSFGTMVTLPLTQEVFAKFILRAKEDEQHIEIMNKIRPLCDELEELEVSVNAALSDASRGANASDLDTLQLAFRRKDVDLLNLLYDKAESGLRILNEIRREYV